MSIKHCSNDRTLPSLLKGCEFLIHGGLRETFQTKFAGALKVVLCYDRLYDVQRPLSLTSTKVVYIDY